MVFTNGVAAGGTFASPTQGLAISIDAIGAEQEVLKQDVLTLSSTTNTLQQGQTSLQTELSALGAQNGQAIQALQIDIDATNTAVTAVTDEANSLSLAVSNLGLLAAQNKQAIQTLTDKTNAVEAEQETLQTSVTAVMDETDNLNLAISNLACLQPKTIRQSKL